MLIRQLPLTSRTARAQFGPAADWGPAEHLLAHVADLLAGANWQRGGGKGQRPSPIPRPRSTTTHDRPERRRLSPSSLLHALGGNVTVVFSPSQEVARGD
ncbi:MAG: hypothetical protein AB7H43_10700 [Acidimicrobiia bacterium]